MLSMRRGFFLSRRKRSRSSSDDRIAHDRADPAARAAGESPRFGVVSPLLTCSAAGHLYVGRLAACCNAIDCPGGVKNLHDCNMDGTDVTVLVEHGLFLDGPWNLRCSAPLPVPVASRPVQAYQCTPSLAARSRQSDGVPLLIARWTSPARSAASLRPSHHPALQSVARLPPGGRLAM